MPVLKRLPKTNRSRLPPTLILLFASCLPGFGINCKQISQFIGVYVKMHYATEAFDDEISRRTLENFFKALDPGKMYFLKRDLEESRGAYGTELDNRVLASDCRALNAVLRRYGKRYEERQPVIADWIEAEHDFSIDEYFDIDRKKREWLETEDELNERWRRNVKYQLMQLKKRYGELPKARERLHKRYELAEKYLKELDSVEVASIFLNAFSKSLDPHTSYMSPDDLEDFRISTALSLEGIGAVLRSEYGITTVQRLVPGGPADKAGELKVADTIVAVAQKNEEPVDVIDMKLRNVVKMIRGERGKEVRLFIEREEKDGTNQLEIAIVRDKIELNDREAKAYTYSVEVHENPISAREYRIGLIKLPSFYLDFAARNKKEEVFRSSSADVRSLIDQLKSEKIDALVMDLRSNSGGSFDEAVNIAGLFFDYGPVVQVKSTDGRIQILADTDNQTYYDGPLIILINRNSASSSEIFAGAIQDYGRGLIIGDSHSFGKGTVQKVNEVRKGELGAVKVTISQFFRPSGSSTQLKGVESDIVLPDIVDEYKIGEKFYDYVLPWNKIEEADFARFSLVSGYLDSLNGASADRVELDKDFQKLSEDIREYREKGEERTRISLKVEVEEESESGLEASDLEGKDGDEPGLDRVSEIDEAPASHAGDDEHAADEKAIASDDSSSKEEESETKEDDKRPSLEEDIMLREALAIAADYLQLLNDKTLVAISYPELEEADLVDKAAEELSGMQQ